MQSLGTNQATQSGMNQTAQSGASQLDTNTTKFDYDNAGNLLKDDKASYSYDGFNRTTKVETFDGNIQINRYDAEGLRYDMEEERNDLIRTRNKKKNR